MKLALLFLLAAGLMFGQTAHSVTLNWTDTLNPAGTTYNVYRAAGPCSGTPTFSKITATPLTDKTYVDTAVQPGPYCYVATAMFNSVESAYSDSALASVPTFAVKSLTIVVK
jgi:hypothetical protein